MGKPLDCFPRKPASGGKIASFRALYIGGNTCTLQHYVFIYSSLIHIPYVKSFHKLIVIMLMYSLLEHELRNFMEKTF